MASSPTNVDRIAARSASANGSEVGSAVRNLIRLASRQGATSNEHLVDGEPHEFLLDVEVDGVRCILVVPHQVKPERLPFVLSPREREIARMVAKGYPNKTIAAVLDISSWTVCTYLRRIFAKLNVCSRAAMVATLVEHGLMKEHDGHADGTLPRRQ